MMSLLASFTRRIFICTISIIALLSHDVVVVVAAAAAAAADAAAADAAASDASSMMSCEKIAPLWISTPYNASVMYDNGDTEIIAGLQANLTITEQVGCRAVGINSWTNGMVGGNELVAVAIVPPYDNAVTNETQLIIMEIGEHPVEGTSAYIDATLNGDTTNTQTMHWVYEGRSNNHNETENVLSYGIVFEAMFYEGSVPESTSIIPDEEDSNCVDISGVWTSDPYTYIRMYIDDGRNEIVGPTQNLLNLTQNGCQILGTNAWDNGVMIGIDHVAGVVIGSTVNMFEVFQETHADMSLNALIDDDGNMITHGLGHAFPLDYVMASNVIFGRGDTAPNVDFPNCDTDLVGTWKSINDINLEMIDDIDGDAIADTSSNVFADVVFTIDGQSESGCEFWGSLGDLLKFGGIVKSNGKDFLLTTEADDLLGSFQFGVSVAHIMPNSDDSKDRIALTYLSRSEDEEVGLYFNAIFEKESTYTPVPPVIVIDSTTDATFDDSSSATSSLFVTSAHYYHHTSFIRAIFVTASFVTSLFIL